MASGDIGGAIRAWLDLIDVQTAVARYLLESREVDFFMTVYTASDWGGHNLWKYFDPEHGEHDAEEAASRRGSLLAIYRALDSAIGRLLAFADEGTQVYIISDHGMGRHSGASYHLTTWLEAKGYMRRRARPASESVVRAAASVARRWLPQGIKDGLKSRLGQKRIRSFQSTEKDAFYESVDWSRTTAYAEPGRHVININLEGRNFAGTVPADRYDATCEQIAGDLMHWKDERGYAVVESVVRRDRAYAGPFVDRASDLFINWDAGASLWPAPDEVRARGFWWSGDHRPEGVLICKGPGIRRGAAISQARVYDLVPTIMHLAGLAAPGSLDGRILEEACEGNQPVQRLRPAAQEELPGQPRVVGEVKDKSAQAAELTESEEEQIESKLRDLGYL
jgi:predicted AlkP superfamily phosphohydrolase/phosphomutase